MAPFEIPFSDLGLRKGPIKILRPNPNIEQDLEWHSEMDPRDEVRVKTYPKLAKRRKVSGYCACEFKVSPGPAPLLPLGYGKWIPSFGIGTWLGYKPPKGDVSVKAAVIWAIDNGYRLIDTADSYGTEEQVGQAVNYMMRMGVVKRNEVFVTTKLWNDAHAKNAVVPALRKSLQRLNLDYVDLYLIHWPTGVLFDGRYDATDYIETWRGMLEARNQGLARNIGVANFSQYQLERMIGFTKEKPSVLQVELNLNLQQPELLAYCHEQNIVVMAYSPFGSLFDHNAAWDAPPPRVNDPELIKIAEKHKKTVPQVVLRYLIELGAIPTPQPVTSHTIREYISVFDFKLTDSDRKLIQSYDCEYRTMDSEFVKGHPYDPFPRKPEWKFSIKETSDVRQQWNYDKCRKITPFHQLVK